MAKTFGFQISAVATNGGLHNIDQQSDPDQEKFKP
jgi:hypothetical protein